MQNVIAINSAARQSIIAAQATSDEMLLKRIADGDRTAMHTLYCPAQRAGLPFHPAHRARHHAWPKTSSARSSSTCGAPRANSRAVRRSRPGCLSIARFKALTSLRQRRFEDIDQDDVREIADEADTPEASLDRSNTSAILRACVAKLSPAHREIINLVYYHEKSVEEAGRNHRHPAEHGEDPHVLCPQAARRPAAGAPASKASPRERIRSRREPRRPAQKQRNETNETIDEITRKKSPR